MSEKNFIRIEELEKRYLDYIVTFLRQDPGVLLKA